MAHSIYFLEDAGFSSTKACQNEFSSISYDLERLKKSFIVLNTRSVDFQKGFLEKIQMNQF